MEASEISSGKGNVSLKTKEDTLPTTTLDNLPKPHASKVTSSDFATEVRTDRLSLLWRIMIAVGLFLVWIAFMRRDSNGIYIGLSGLILLLGSTLTSSLLRVNRYNLAVWAFMLGLTLSASVPLITQNQDAVNIAPFIFPVLVFIMGLMLGPSDTFVLFGITAVLTFLLPVLFWGGWAFLTVYQFVSVTLSIVSALLAAQVTGELYQITDWALENYQRERRTSLDLFENRQRLEKSLLRSEVLGEKLQDINTELESAKHFRGQFLANMSHELRTPLNAIIGFSETMLSFPMMYDDIELPDAYRRDLMQIHTSGQQLLTVINDILDLSKVDAGKLEMNLEKVQLDPLIDSVMMTAAGLVSKKPIELKRDVIHPLPDVFADEARLRQVLLNLYSNASKFTESGTITIMVRKVKEGVQISVKDTGEGIQEDVQESIFEEFSQVENKGRDPRAGAGLGLAISRKLLTLMNGRIWVESTFGEGATFHVIVPAYDANMHGLDEGTRPRIDKVRMETARKTGV